MLAAAVMHAGWNVLVKLKLDRFLSLCLIQTIMGFMGIAMLLVFPLPSLASLPFAVASACCTSVTTCSWHEATAPGT